MRPPYERTVHSVWALAREPIFDAKSGEKWLFLFTNAKNSSNIIYINILGPVRRGMERTTAQKNETRMKRIMLWKLYKKELVELCPPPTSRYNKMKKAQIVRYLVDNMTLEECFELNRWKF